MVVGPASTAKEDCSAGGSPQIGPVGIGWGVLSPAEIHKLASKTKQAVGATTGTKADCHRDYVDDDTAKSLQAVELVELETH